LSASGAKKRFGQNFLHDKGVIARILQHIHAQPGEAVVEIGPGRGALTEGLIRSAGSVTAIEIDRDLIEALQRRFGGALELLVQDVLTVDFEQIAKVHGKKLRIVGNLPYNISSPILFHLLPWASQVTDQTFMLQKEVVDRMVAAEGSKVYGRLSVMLQARYTMERLFLVPPGAFFPAPAVDSAIVAMWPIPQEQCGVRDWAVFERLVADAFSSRRKMIRNTLAAYEGRLDLASAGVQETDRPEAISVESYMALANQLSSGTPLI
jgi:16S rRNA (adenine1518-N6/adenine1519-N6)-dimethyltransferase